MWSFNDQYNHFQDMSQDENSDVLTIAKKNINLGQKILETELGYPPEEASRTFTTTTSDTYNLPENFIRAINLYVTVGTTRYNAEQVFDEGTWQMLKRRTSGSSSNYMTNFFVRQLTFEVYPTASSSGNTMTMLYEAMSKDLINADYATGTITTLANAGTAVTGSSTSWSDDSIIGRYFKINTDGQWYRITARGSATTLTIANPYQGLSISAGTSAYTIGEMPRTPASTHIIPVYYALWQHFQGVRRDPSMAKYYKNLFDQQMQWAKSTLGQRYSTQVIPSQRHLRRRALLNPNWYPESIS